MRSARCAIADTAITCLARKEGGCAVIQNMQSIKFKFKFEGNSDKTAWWQCFAWPSVGAQPSWVTPQRRICFCAAEWLQLRWPDQSRRRQNVETIVPVTSDRNTSDATTSQTLLFLCTVQVRAQLAACRFCTGNLGRPPQPDTRTRSVVTA